VTLPGAARGFFFRRRQPRASSRAVESASNPSPARPASAPAFRVSFNPTLREGREAARAVAAHLAATGLRDEDVFACELALVEACNNAVHHLGPSSELEPVEVEAVHMGDWLQFSVHDHTPGFDLPAEIPRPAAEIERGRGLFLMRSTMDEMRYLRGSGRNTLVLRKRINGARPDRS
jgi:anti-sigma regulatory factor (Ser/Thr protein kinase)